MQMRGTFIFFLLLMGSFALPADASQDEIDQTLHPDRIEKTSSIAPPKAPPERNRRDTHDFRASLIRSAIIALGLVIFAVGVKKDRLSLTARRLRMVALIGLALAAYSSYYQFFRLGHPHGFSTTDNFHYYVGSKYFKELGHYGLYECSLSALHERGVNLPGGHDPQVRDLRSMELRRPAVIRAHGSDCQNRFSPERWRSFSQDVGFFVEKWPPHVRNAVWSDHGYHPTPVWTVVGASVAERISLHDRSHRRFLTRIDRVLIAATLVAVAWAFGLEVGCLVAILWGTGHLWRYTWVGDAYLRHLWWIASLVGLCLLRRGAPGWGGAGLTLATALRLFPGALGIGYLAGALSDRMRGRAANQDLFRFVLGSGITLSALASLVVFNLGFQPFAEFAAKIGEFTALSATNKVGLGALLSHFPAFVKEHSGLWRAGLILFFGALYWRGLRDAQPWEAAALGFAIIPWFTDPTNYYYSFFPMGAILAARRPLIGVILLATALGWNLSGLWLYRSYAEFGSASAIAILGATAVTWAMGRAAQAEMESKTEATPPHLSRETAGPPQSL